MFHLLYNEGGDALRAKMWFPKQQRLDIYVNGMFMNPNNLDFESESYNLLPPGGEYIPALTEPQGSNYFDPNTGHLYLIVKGPSTIEVKTQPIVVLKLGMTVPIENFFESNVVGNLAGLLGIDPSNIRVTNIVREGSVSGRKKREEGDIIGVEFAIGPPPVETLGAEFIPPEHEGITATTPDTSGTTVNPLYTTAAPVVEATTEWVAPEGYLDFEALAAVSANLVNSFQTGTLDLNIEGANITGLGLEAPIAPPQEPPTHRPEDPNLSTGLTWAEQVALNNSALLEEYEPKAFDVPEDLAVSDEVEDAAEMRVLANPVRIYARDENGGMISELGDITDPWLCTVSVLSGPGGTVMGTTTVEFTGGIATFNDIYIGQAGDDYVLQFEVSYPVTTVAPATSLPFNVAGRPLGIQFTEEAPLVAQNSTFSVTATIWDDALDQAAEPSVLAAHSWDCSIALVNGTLNGTTEIVVGPGDNMATFDDIMVEEAGLSYDLEVTCVSSDGGIYLTAQSQPFHVHDYPEVGMLRETDVRFTFNGPLKKVEGILSNFNSAMGTVTCKGCPDGMTDRKKRDTSSQPLDLDLCLTPLTEDC